MRIFTIIVGLAMVYLGSAHNIGSNPLQFDARNTSFSIAATTVTLDTVLVVVGGVLLIGALVFKGLSQGE